MSTSSQEQSHSMTSDCSFIILNQGSLPSDLSFMSNGLPSKCEQQQLRSSIISNAVDVATNQELNHISGSHGSWNCDSHSQDIQIKLDQLLKENQHLKETLNQNNLAMKTQFETLVMWQEEVFKTHQSHKQKFSETRDLVLKLRTENGNLKKLIEEGKVDGVSKDSLINSDLELENSTLKRKVDDLQQKLMQQSKNEVPSKKEQELLALVDNLLQKLEVSERQCRQLGITNENLIIQKNKSEERCKKAEQDAFGLKKQLEDISIQNDKLKLSITELQRDGRKDSTHSLLPNSEARAQISNLFKQLEEERTKVSQLKEQLHMEKSTKSLDMKENTSIQLNECISKLDDLDLSFDKQNERFSSMSSWLCLAEENMDSSRRSSKDLDSESRMKAEIASLKNHLRQEQTDCQHKKENLQEMQKQFEKLLMDYEKLQNDWKIFDESGPMKKCDEQISSLTSELKAKDELLSKKDKECETLKEYLKKMHLQCEEVEILRAQVDLYQTDFNAERESREKLVGEKEGIAEQLRLQMRKNQDLEAQLTALRVPNSTETSSTSVAAAPTSNNVPIAASQPEETTPATSASPDASEPNQEEDLPLKPFSCFKCEESFREFRQLQEHVEECLELSN